MDKDKEEEKLQKIREKLAKIIEDTKENNVAFVSFEWAKKNILNIK